LVPTRELAAQVQESVRAYGKYHKLRSTVVFGGVGFNPQADALKRGVDIVVATPGRLLDHVEQRTIDLRHVEILVLDEADRMLDMGFIPAIRRVLALLPKERQNLLFSATFPDEIRKLANGFMKNPATVEVAPRNKPVELISQVVHPVDSGRKRELLAHLVKSNNWHQVLVFTRTKHGANRLAQQLERDGIESDAIHGNKSQGARTRALKRFKDNELQVLVATDIAARGLDIEELPHVVVYDLPHVAEDYVHRIGRTGRAGASGEAVVLVSGEDRSLLAAVERLIGRRIEQKIVPGFEPGTASRSPAPRHEPQRHQPRQQQGRHDRGQQRHRDGNRDGNRDDNRGNRDSNRDDNRGNREGANVNRSHQGHNGGHSGGQQRRRDGNRNGNRQQQRYGQQPQRQQQRQQDRQQFRQGVQAPRQERREEDEDRQPSPERAGNQMFPGLLGGLGRMFGRKGR
jgi:ATP-dependent RNA helicase RhlE